MSERDEETGSGAPKSSASVGTIHTMPHDEDSVAQVLAPVLHRIDDSPAGPQALIVTADRDTALAFARAAVAAETRLLPATSEGRALRLLRAGAIPSIAGPATALVGLIRQSALKLDGIRIVVLAWADEILAAEQGEALESLMSEIPKDAARVLVTAQLSPLVEELAERYFRRAHRLAPSPSPEGLSPVVMSYVSVTDASRRGALRRVLDELDPPSAAIIVRSERGTNEALETLRELGYPNNDPNIAVMSAGADPDVSLIILYEIPASPEDLRSLVGAGTPRVVAFARPRDLARLGTLAGLAPTPLPPREATDRAARAAEVARDELRAELKRGLPDRQIIALEPLLDEFDGIEIAGAALRMLERARERAAVTAAAATASAQTAQPAAFVRIFMTVGTRDNVGRGDLVGMITAEGGITSAQIGKVDIRDNHSLVEVASPVAEQVAAKISGSAVKGRRIVARLERTREERTSRGGDDRPRGREDRPRGGGFERSGPRQGGDRGGRPPSRGPSDRGSSDRGSSDRGHTDRGQRDSASEGRAPRGAAPPRRGE